MLVNRYLQLLAVYRTSRTVTLFRCLLVRPQLPILVRNVQSENVTKLLLEDVGNLKLTQDRKLYENTHSSRLWKLHTYSLVFLLTLSYSAISLYATLKPAEDKRETNSWSVNYIQRAHSFLCKWKLIICGLCFGFGVAQFVGMTVFITRNVHSIMLLKNGREVIIKTFGPTPVFKQLKTHRKKLSEVSCLNGRNENVSNLQLAIAGSKHKLYIDKSGRFYSPELFDTTVGVMRKLRKNE